MSIRRSAHGQPTDPVREPGRFGVAAFVGRRAGADRPILLAVFLVLLTTTTMAAATVWAADQAARTGLTRRLVGAGPAATGLGVVATAAIADAATRATELRAEVERALPGVPRDVLQVTQATGSFALPGGGDPPDLTVFAAVDGLADRATVTKGRWPEAGATPLEVALTEPAAAAMTLATGDPLTVQSRVDPAREVPVIVVGVIRLTDPADPIFLDVPLLPDGRRQGESFVTLGPLLVDPADLAATGEPRVEITTTAHPEVEAIEPVAVDPLRAGLAALPARLEDLLGRPRAATVRTGLPELLDRTAGSLLVSGTAILVLDLQLAIIGGYAVILVAMLVRDWRAGETALLRTRGASRTGLLRFTGLEALVLVGAAVILGPLLAWIILAVTSGLTTPPTLDGPVVAALAVASLVGLVGLLLPGLLASAPLASVRRSIGRQLQGTVAQRTGLDLALVAVAGLALWQLRAYGGPLTTSVRGSIGVDPLLVIAPAIGLLAGAVLSMRLIPLVAGRLAGRLDRRSGLVGWIGSRQLARRPLRYTAPALLLVVAVGIGGFSLAYAATWDGSQVDQVGHELGADVALSLDERTTMPTWAQGAAIREAVGDVPASPVRRDGFDLGGWLGRGELVAIDAERLADVVRLRPDLADASADALSAALVAARGTDALPTLPDEPTAIALELDADLQATHSDGSPVSVSPDWRGLRAVVVVRDGAGRLVRAAGPTVALGDGRVRIVAPLVDEAAADRRPSGPFEIVSLGVEVRMPPSLTVTGEVAITDVAATGDDAAAGEDLGAAGTPWPTAWTRIGVRDDGWVPVRIDADTDPRRAETAGPDDPLRFVLPPGDALAESFGTTLALRPASLDPAILFAIPALIDERLAAAVGAAPGDRIEVGERFDDPWSLHVVDVVRLVPTTDAARPAVLADLRSLELADLAHHDATTTTTAWWLARIDEASVPALAAAVPQGNVITATAEEAARLDDPVVRGLTGALAATTIASALFAIIGLVVSMAVGARDRRAEFAVLAALGLSGRGRDRELAMEAAFIVGCGLIAGLVVAVVLAWVVLPSVALKVEAGPVVPPVEVVWPVWVLVPTALAAIGLWALLVVVARRQLPVAGTAQAIREVEP